MAVKVFCHTTEHQFCHALAVPTELASTMLSDAEVTIGPFESSSQARRSSRHVSRRDAGQLRRSLWTGIEILVPTVLVAQGEGVGLWIRRGSRPN
jgi:hypothetical protein